MMLRAFERKRLTGVKSNDKGTSGRLGQGCTAARVSSVSCLELALVLMVGWAGPRAGALRSVQRCDLVASHRRSRPDSGMEA
jgi:hypothetical protein